MIGTLSDFDRQSSWSKTSIITDEPTQQPVQSSLLGLILAEFCEPLLDARMVCNPWC
jgi:hypothetical protein